MQEPKNQTRNEDQLLGNSRLKLEHVWAHRHDGVDLFMDRLIAYSLAAYIAHLCILARLTPNMISFVSGVMAIITFVAGVSLPTGHPELSVLLIFALAQLTYVFDCADGLVARITGTTSNFGDFVDKGVDAAANALIFGGFFAYLYRFMMETENAEAAGSWLLIGFFFLLARSSRFAVWQRLEAEHGVERAEHAVGDGLLVTVLKNFIDTQVSLFLMLLFLISPVLACASFMAQAIVLFAVYGRYFFRAKDLFKD